MPNCVFKKFSHQSRELGIIFYFSENGNESEKDGNNEVHILYKYQSWLSLEPNLILMPH